MKISSEVFGQVYKHEKLAPPNPAEFSSAFAELGSGVMNLARKPIVDYTPMQIWNFSLLGLELVGFYTIGKVIGRRQIIGYEH